ncbi:MAG: hypothetical protein K2L13_02725 [Opitutales bacterium]|nr:hypothetical protein [Opitutales bacterium]
MKSNDRTGFILVEILLAVALFALAATALNHSFINGLICQNQFFNKPNKFSELISFIVSTSSSISELENTKSISLPSGEMLDTTFKVDQTKTNFLYKVSIQTNLEKWNLYVANLNWDEQ